MTRTYIVTGSASGIGAATAARLRADGHRVVGADIRDAELIADLSTVDGRASFTEQARLLTDGRCDGVIAVAGVAVPTPLTVALNYFGAVATLDAVRPLLARSGAPRAVVIGSLGALAEIDDRLFALLLRGDEPGALELADRIDVHPDPIGTSVLYTTAKRALARWVREHAPTAEWAGAGIALNVVAPGVTRTPLTARMLDTEEGRATFAALAPTPLNGPAADPAWIADASVWLAGEANRFVTGQVLYVDGGTECLMRPDHV